MAKRVADVVAGEVWEGSRGYWVKCTFKGCSWKGNPVKPEDDSPSAVQTATRAALAEHRGHASEHHWS